MGLIDDIPSCQELQDRMVRDAEGIIGGLQKLVVRDAKL